MEPNEINKAIAEWMGLRSHEAAPTGDFYSRTSCVHCGEPLPTKAPICVARKYSDFFNDLNAVHEAEGKFEAKSLSDLCGPDYAKIYREGLEALTYKTFGGVWHATAPQRCEALLRTIGKWRAK